MSSLLQRFKQSSYLYGGNAPFIEQLYEAYLDDPESVSDKWKDYFHNLEQGAAGDRRDVAHSPIRESFTNVATQPAAGPRTALGTDAAKKQAQVLRLINYYRVRGHQAAAVDPLQLSGPRSVPDLDPMFHNLSEADMDTVFNVGSLVAPEQMRLRDILELLRETYTGSVGAQYMYMTSTKEKRWFQHRLEGPRAHPNLNQEEKLWLLKSLTAAEGLEKYLHNRYVGQKRFSLEGGDSLIPMLDELIQRSGANGVKEVVIGMAHRGRLNVLVNIIGKSPQMLFEEFEGKSKIELSSSGDVKYHMGFSYDVDTPGGAVHLALAFNPSHLEIANPVVEGSVRARQERRGDTDRTQVMPILVHGDAAFAGQGVVMETLQMSLVRGYRTGGTVHVIVNNQIGFTTSARQDVRSSEYCTDVAKMLECPIFHVNADDPEAVVFVTRLALDYRIEFNKDVVVDLICYRRHGHNEADEPSATQPMMYKKIKAHPTTRKIYADKLVEEGTVEAQLPDALSLEYRDALDDGRSVSRPMLETPPKEFVTDWSAYTQIDWNATVDTAVDLETLQSLSDRLLELPEGFEVNPRVAKIMGDRRKMAAGVLPLDWGFAENMAYATLLHEGHHVRLSGQDCGRGTFFHRHAVLHNQKDGSTHVPLRHLAEKPEQFLVIDSLLSEEAVLGFEYGYSTAEPRSLVIWEAQFGDFANGAQVVIDQFISSGETKWGRLCGLTMLLPHGYEGQGPEHSSARLERYLQLCAEHNMQVCVPSNPSQIFHVLRRQMVRSFRKPLIIMSPKSLLRHKLAVNSPEDLTQCRFETVMSEVDDIKVRAVDRIVFCSGKVFYDLLETRRERQLKNVAIVRIEQLYPFPQERYEEEVKRYARARHIVWCQEEPENQGAWYQIQHRVRASLTPKHTLRYAGRAASASPAAGQFSMHVEQQTGLVNQALEG
jgi:2-oxoglutarate dehydrogenase E1 component